MTTFESVAVIGLGLIGGSIARDLAALGVEVRAYDADATRLAAAIRTNVVRVAMDASLDGIRGVDAVIIAIPVDAAIDALRRLAAHARGVKLITDVGSTKTRIVDVASELSLGDRFVGGHPMTGDHRSGWDASRQGLFRNAPVYLCPTRESSSDAVAAAMALWHALGARPGCMSARQHDLKLAWTSHLPHMVSTSLALALAHAGVDRVFLGPGGRDTTRLAGGSPEMWTAIALENATSIAGALKQAERELADLRASLERADPDELRARFENARAWFEGEGQILGGMAEGEG
jgi:prephenate dehydrogenase